MRVAAQLTALVGATAVLAADASAPTENYVSGDCVTDYDEADGYDYFPEKFENQFSEYFDITYMGTYKVITNSYSGQTTVAYQCGTPVPNITADLLVSVPITKAAFTTTTYIPWIELLGMRTTIKAYTSDFSYVTSACLNQLYDEGETVSVASGWSYDNAALEALNVSVTFADSWSSSAYNALVVTAANEDSVLKTAEYVGLFGAMYNMEAKANEIIDAIEDRYACVTHNAETRGHHDPKPRVLWLSYTEDYSGGGGWSVGSCPNYYCEVIGDAGGDMIEYNETGSVLLWGYYYYLNDTELLSRATMADYVIYQGNFSWAYEAKKDVLNQIPAVASKDVFDTWGRGSNDWFESRAAEPDVFLEDMVKAINPDAMAEHTKVWLRDPFEDPVGSAPTTCDDVDAVLELQADDCDYIDVCSNDDSWYRKKASRDCEWVAKKPHKYCSKESEDGVEALLGCPVSCDTCQVWCEDDDSWYKKGSPAKGCDWVAKKPSSYCKREGDDGTYGFEGCPVTCGQCGCQDDALWLNKGKSGRNCDWVSKDTSSRCRKRSSDGTKAKNACRATCKNCGD